MKRRDLKAEVIRTYPDAHIRHGGKHCAVFAEGKRLGGYSLLEETAWCYARVDPLTPYRGPAMNPTRAGSFSFPDSGNESENEKIANRFRLHSERMAQNICPNGCGKMNWIDPHNRECQACGFGGFSTVPYDMEGGNA